MNKIIQRVVVVDADAILVPELGDDKVFQLDPLFQLFLGDFGVEVQRRKFYVVSLWGRL